ncbi:TPA: hypothetical protein UMV35_003690 [Stenotrophomonas maltophilia]|jgi:hypothetical protein|uniref:hypothetical protein n=1 Tax=Stenotrophomonas sp. GD03680 TaxID=2975365 RepID=UPI00244C787C|nr:hypothetical protein [Stenotrophomonas sp. GD03680]MDH2023604.1 hypothetical protein [Stenotrophomonas sp. GD03680]HEL3751352.1 hypothetical protein [Stenotrophomonas maltophilia]HEL7728680.1 hypothetical protein [Stenotrophomonas maltophilia]
MAKVNKERLMHILRLAEDANPQHVNLSIALGDEVDDAIVEIQYLKDHGLLDVHISRMLDGDFALGGAHITSAGLDYLSEDGGLTEELGSMKIKIHAESLQQMLELMVLRSDLDQPQKQRYVDELRKLPAETTKHLALKAVDAAIAQSGKLLPLLQSMLG